MPKHEPPGWNDVKEIAGALLFAAGCSQVNAVAVAAALVDAETAGRRAHGVRLVQLYVGKLLDRSVDGWAIPTIDRDLGPVVAVSGNGGFAPPAGDLAARIGLDRAKANGVALVALRDVFHLGRNARWPEKAAQAGIASVHFGHGFRSRASVVAFGGTEPTLGTNPVAIGVPTADGPLVLDFSTAETSANAVRLAAEEGRLLPSACLIRSDGTATDDASAFVDGDAAIAAFGGHKGFGLSLMTELLAGAIASGGGGAWPGRDALLSIYIDPLSLADAGGYEAFVARLLRSVRGTRVAPGRPPVRLPGDDGRRSRTSVVSGRGPDPDAVRALVAVSHRLPEAADDLARRWPGLFTEGD